MQGREIRADAGPVPQLLHVGHDRRRPIPGQFLIINEPIKNSLSSAIFPWAINLTVFFLEVGGSCILHLLQLKVSRKRALEEFPRDLSCQARFLIRPAGWIGWTQGRLSFDLLMEEKLGGRSFWTLSTLGTLGTMRVLRIMQK